MLLVQPQSHALVDLRRDQTTNEVMAITFAEDVVTMTDPNGAMSFDLLQNTAVGAGLWREMALRGDATANPDAPLVNEIRPFTCFRNCALKETGMWAIKKLSSTVKAVLAMRACLQAIGGDPPAVDTCVSLFTRQGERDRARFQRGQSLHQVRLRMRQPRHPPEACMHRPLDDGGVADLVVGSARVVG